MVQLLTNVTPQSTHLDSILVVKMVRHPDPPDFAARQLPESAPLSITKYETKIFSVLQS